MAINFPTENLTTGTTHSHNGKVWQWDGPSWTSGVVSSSLLSTGGGVGTLQEVTTAGASTDVSQITMTGAGASQTARFDIKNNNTMSIVLDSSNGITTNLGKGLYLGWLGSSGAYKMQVDGSTGDITTVGFIKPALIKDKDNDSGTPGQVLSSTSSGLDWITVSGGDKIQENDTSVECIDDGTGDRIEFKTSGTEAVQIDANSQILISGSQTGDNIAKIYNTTDGLSPSTGILGIFASSNNATPRDVRIYSGGGTANEIFRAGKNGQIGVDGGDVGTAGQVLTSGGPNASATWENASGGGSDYTLEALLSPGVQLVKDGTASATDRVFFNGSGGLSVTRTSTDPWTIEFDASQVTGTIPILDVTNWSSTANDNVGTSKTGTINRAAFEKAIGSLVNTGGIIYVPHGDYQINGTINITNTGTNKVEDGGGIVIMGPNYRVGAADSEGARLIAQDATSDIFKITNVRNVEIKQLAFDSAVTRTGGNAIHCYSNTNTQQIKLERLYIRQQFGGIKMDGHSMSILRDIEMRHFNDIANSYGLIISASEGGTERVDQIRCQNVLIDGEVVGGNSNVGNASNNTVGIQIQDFTNSVWFDHCVANRCTYGMNFHTSMPSGGTGNPGSFFRVSDCDFDTNSHSGINVEGGSFIWVNSPYIGSNKRNGIRTTSNFTGVLRINDADCRGNSEHGIYIASTGHKKIMINNPQCCENGASTWSGTGSGDGIRIVNNANDIQIQGGQCGGDVMGSTGGSTTNNSRQQDTGIRFEGVNGGSHARCTVAFVDCTDNNNDAIDFNTQSGSYNYQVGVAGHGGVANNGQWPT